MKQTTRKYSTHSLTLTVDIHSFYQACFMCSHFNTVYGQLGAIIYSVRDACKMIFLGYDNISAINNEVEC